MKTKISIKACPFCGKDVTTRIGVGNITYFQCVNKGGCGAVVSFTGNMKLGNGAYQVANPLENWSRRYV